MGQRHNNTTNNPSMKMYTALEGLKDFLENALIVSKTGSNSNKIFSMRHHPKKDNLYRWKWNFVTRWFNNLNLKYTSKGIPSFTTKWPYYRYFYAFLHKTSRHSQCLNWRLIYTHAFLYLGCTKSYKYQSIVVLVLHKYYILNYFMNMWMNRLNISSFNEKKWITA